MNENHSLQTKNPEGVRAGEREYAGFLAGRPWWRGAVAIALLVGGWVIVTVGLSVGALALSTLLGLPTGFGEGPSRITPLMFLAVNLTWAALIPLSLGIQRLLYGEAASLHSVVGRVRWGLLVRVALVLVPVYLLVNATGVLEGFGAGDRGRDAGAFLLVCLLTTPLQAAGEEYAFRGLLTRAVGGWFRGGRAALIVGGLVSSLVFMVAHGAGDAWLNAHYLSFGLALTGIAWRTGGLEAGVAMHVVNNMVALGVGVWAGQDLGQMANRQAGVGGPFMLLPIASSIVIAAVVWWWTARHRTPRSAVPPRSVLSPRSDAVSPHSAESPRSDALSPRSDADGADDVPAPRTAEADPGDAEARSDAAAAGGGVPSGERQG